MVPRSLPKQVSNQHPNLHRFWNKFRSILGGFWEPSWHQIAPKVDAQRYQKNDHLSDRSWEQLSWILASIWEPRWSLKPPSRSQDRAKTPQSWRQDRLKTSTWSQDGPKRSPRAKMYKKPKHFRPPLGGQVGTKIYQKSILGRSKR